MAEEIAQGEPHPEVQESQDFVVVLAYTSNDSQIEEDFGRLVEDIKALYTFKQNVRVYALVEEAAGTVLSFIEKPKEPEAPKPGNRVVLSYEPSDADDPKELLRIADSLNVLFDEYPHLKEELTIEPAAQDLLDTARPSRG